jgi:hypothetical protein
MSLTLSVSFIFAVPRTKMAHAVQDIGQSDVTLGVVAGAMYATEAPDAEFRIEFGTYCHVS